MTTTDEPRRHVGALARLSAVQILRALDQRLASRRGLSLQEAADTLELHPRTIRRYLNEICRLGAPIGGPTRGPYVYTERGFRFFTENADRYLG